MTGLIKPMSETPTTPTVVIESEKELQAALREMSKIESQAKEIDAQTAQEIEAIKQAAAGKMRTKVGSKNVAFGTRLQELRQGVEAYCKTNREELLAKEKKQSRVFPFAKISWRKKAASIEFLKREENTIETLSVEHGLISKLVDYIKRFKFREHPLSLFIDLKPRINKTRLKDAFEQGQITKDDLKAAGMKYMPSSEKFEIKPTDYVVSDEDAQI